jgi:hypothetical protein
MRGHQHGVAFSLSLCRGLLSRALPFVGLLVLAGSARGELTPQGAGQALVTLERGWVENQGQWAKQAAFSAPGYFGTSWVTRDGELRHVASKREDCEKPTPEASEPQVAAKRFRKPCPAQTWVLAERWVGGKVKGIRGEEELETKVSYFLGNDPAKHRSGLPSYRYLSLGEVWPGVEVKLKASQKTVEKLFYVRPGADLGKVRVELRGAEQVRLSQEGALVIETGLGELVLSKPVAWQEKDGKKLPVQASYRLFGKNRYGFVVAGADPSLPLVIDPILQSTYLGGSGDDYANKLAIAGSGDVYVAGFTASTNFPSTAGGAQASYGGGYRDAFVARLNAALTSILQSTYLGGSGDDYANALAIAGSGEVVVAGETTSTNFPNTSGGAQASFGGFRDAFVARLNSTLTSNLQSTYLGGSGDDRAWALAIAGSGEVVVAGDTNSTNFPNTAGGAQASRGGFFGDAFVARLNSALTSNLQSTYLGGSGTDEARALAIAGSGEVLVAGYTDSTNFPNTAGGAQASNGGGGDDAFVARLNATLTQNRQSTYLGGSGYDEAYALAIAGSGEVVVAGDTDSTNFPHTAGGAQASYGGGNYDAFVARLNAALTSNPQSTYLGGSRSDHAHALAIAGSGEVVVAGDTDSTNFPHTAGGAQASFGGFWDAFVARLDAALTSNPQSTFLGGSFGDEADALAIARSGEVLVAGYTTSTNFPNTAGGAQATYGGGDEDAFVARLSGDLRAAGSSCTYSISPTSASVGASGGGGTVSVTTQAGCSWTASSNASWITITSGASGSGNGTVAYSVAANTGAARTGTLTIAGQTFTVNQAAAGVSYSYSYWLVSASHAAGLNNSQWRTDLGILNLSSSRNDVQLVFYGSSGQTTQTTYVAAGSQSILVDVVGQMGASGSGALEVRTSVPAIVSSRTYNQNPAGASCYPNGTLGQNLDAFTAAEGLATGQVAVLPQLTENSQYRTNISLTNAGASAASVKVELFDGSGAKVGEYTESLNAGQFKQKVQPFKNVANQTNLSRGYAKVTVVSGNGVVAVASVIDNVTNDPTTIRMVRL